MQSNNADCTSPPFLQKVSCSQCQIGEYWHYLCPHLYAVSLLQTNLIMMDQGIILCVDDDTTVLIALRTLLTHALEGLHLIEIAESGAEALEILRDLESSGHRVSVVISDFIMPGMRGDELLIQVHQQSPSTVTIMLTGQSDFEGVKRAINQANLYRFLEKPFNYDDIVLTVKSALLAYEHEYTLQQQNTQLRNLNGDLEVMLRKVQESERFLEERVVQRTRELDEKNQALQQALRTLEDVERIARHDLKTPLVSIAAAPSLFRAGRQLSRYEEELLSMIESAASRALSMVNLSLDLFRMENGSYVFRPATVNLKSIAAAIVLGLAAQARSKSVTISFTDDDSPVYVEADDSLCYSILGNLIKNAVEAAPEHSAVRLSIAESDMVQLEIHNLGCVPPELRDNFFAKYSTSGKQGGTGLGTYSSHLLAAVQGGSLSMRTSEATGTSLFLQLKAAAAPSSTVIKTNVQALRDFAPSGQETAPATVHATVHANSHSGQSKESAHTHYQLLLVDDDDFNQMVMREMIPQSRFNVDTAINGRMALDMASQQRPDFIIMDIEMPIMGGTEALHHIRQFQSKAKQQPSLIIAYSGNDDTDSRAGYLAAGFDACLHKPCSQEDVLGLLAGLIAEVRVA